MVLSVVVEEVESVELVVVLSVVVEEVDSVVAVEWYYQQYLRRWIQL